MKQLISLIFAIALLHVKAQENPSKEHATDTIQTKASKNAEEIIRSANTSLAGSFEFTKSIPKERSPMIRKDSGDLEKIEKNHKVTVLYEQNDEIYFTYWQFTDSGSTSAKLLNNQVFVLPKPVFEAITRPIYRRYKGVTAGAYTVPFRLRAIGSSDFDFESSLSLQANLVVGFGNRYQKDSWFDASFGMGLTGVNLNEKNSNVEEERSATAFTLSLGAVIKPTRYANIGIFIGGDFLGKKDRDVDWKHNKKIWLGLGINVSLNEISTDKPASGNN